MNPDTEPQFRDQVDQIDNEMFQEEYREEQALIPDFKKPGYVREMDEDELMEMEDCV